MPLTEDDHVVETLAPEGSDQSLRNMDFAKCWTD
jgi:hypothetical protein